MERREATLVESKSLSPSVVGLTFRATDGLPLSFVPGQWIDLHLVIDGVAHKRAYSIANAPGSPTQDSIELAVTRVDGGVMSNALFAMKPGTRIEFDGPHGFFTRDAAHAQRPAVFVGTGTGLAPLRSMLQVETLTPEGSPLLLLFGCRTRQDILWRDEMETWVARCPRLRVEVTLSKPDDTWTGRRGYVQTHIAELIKGLDQPQVYICGLSRMVQDVRRVLKEDLGFDRKQIQSERYD
jgi:ferredoxin-NADP reductase